VEDKDCGPLIKTIMTRCIHCTRCVRFGHEIAGISTLGTLNRGTSTEIGTYLVKNIKSEISGTIIDLCPVGALTSKSYAFKVRPWELKVDITLDVLDNFGSHLYVHHKDAEIVRILPKISCENEGLISDKARFSYDYLNTNRINYVFKKERGEQTKIQWNRFFGDVDKTPLLKKDIAILVNPQVEFKTLRYIQSLSNRSFHRIKVLSVNKKIFTSNLYVQCENASIASAHEESTFCYLLATNPKIESTVFNAKLRRKYLNSTMLVYSVGQAFEYNIPTTFINLSTKPMLYGFECKKGIASLMSNYSNPFFVISENLNTRLYNINSVMTHLKKNIVNYSLFFLSPFSNSQGMNYLNVDSVSKAKINQSKQFFCVNLDDIINTRKILRKKEDIAFWMNSHGSKYASKFQFILPSTTHFENDEIHINLEQKPQRSNSIFTAFFPSIMPKRVIEATFMHKEKTKGKKADTYLKEVSFMERLFKYLSNILANEIFYDYYKGEYTFTSIYPFKVGLDNFYMSNKDLKNSKTMRNSSKAFFETPF